MMRAFKRPTPLKRWALFILADILLISFSMYGSFLIRFDGAIPAEYARHLVVIIALALVVKLFFLVVYDLYSVSWRFFRLRELLRLVQALTFGTLIMGTAVFLLRSWAPFQSFPRSILILDYLFSLGLIGGFRISKRAVREYVVHSAAGSRQRARVLIIGAGTAGEQIGLEMLDSEKSRYLPVGFVDDDPAKRGSKLHGVKILGTRADIPKILRLIPVDEVLVAIPSARSKDIREIVKIIRDTNPGKPIKVLPGIFDLMSGNVTLADIQDIRVEDLLGREPVEIDYQMIRRFLAGRRILITGAGGSIGAELARTVLQFAPEAVALVDIDETELFSLMNRLKGSSSAVEPVIADVRDRLKLDRVFSHFRPQVVLHSAAYKHVPILEYYPEEAIKTNVLGTRLLAELALLHHVDRFVYISTDKAINPTSVMGSTKRVGEELVRTLDRRGLTRFISVRFGNVLGSRGSVIPVFMDQIRCGGPVTVTHPEMKRYFMAISEAVLLVLEAAAAGEGGETFVLDMGEPIRIDDLARDMIRLSGLRPDVDIPIVYSGLRAGEKLFEELLGAEEGTEPTPHSKIFKARNSRSRDEAELLAQVDRLIVLCSGGCRREELIAGLQELVPTFQPDEEQVSIPRW
jgi:FlaA1/EpsC-like NDP-sugar epimerase